MPLIGKAEEGFVRAAQRMALRKPEGSVLHQLGLALTLLVALVSIAGLALAAYAGFHHPGTDWEVVLAFAALAALAERTDLSLYGDSRVSLAFVPIFASIIAAGMPGVAVVVAVATLFSIADRPLYKTGFNFGTLMLAGAASAVAFDSFGMTVSSHKWAALLGITLLAGGLNFLANSALVAVAIAIASRTSIRNVWNEHFMWLWPHYLVLAVLALAMVAAYDLMGLWGIAVFLAPPLMMRFSIKQYVDRTTNSVLQLRQAHGNLQTAHEQLTDAMSSLGKAYDGTLRSLVAALDARDSETAGHSERVAELTMAIAAEMGVEPDTEDWRNISWGALLHDVGKIAIADGILRKPGRLTDEEWEAMRTHPRAGYEILQSIDFLAPAAKIVLSHHERFDGRGYPRGLAGEEIPLGARIFMIADAFDAMTSDRTYRRAMAIEEALAEVLRSSGSQFDPGAVRAFLSVYQRLYMDSEGKRSAEPDLHESLKKAIMEAAAGLTTLGKGEGEKGS